VWSRKEIGGGRGEREKVGKRKGGSGTGTRGGGRVATVLQFRGYLGVGGGGEREIRTKEGDQKISQPRGLAGDQTGGSQGMDRDMRRVIRHGQRGGKYF